MKKIKKLFNLFILDIKTYYKSYIIFLCIVPWFFIKLDYYVFLPGGLMTLEDRIIIDNDYKSSGSFNMTYVSSKSGILPVIALSYIIPSWDLVSIDESRVEHESNDEIIKRNQIYLKETSYDAVIAAFTEAGLNYTINSVDVTVSYIYEDADTNLEVGDIIKSVNGVVIDNFSTLKSEVLKYSENDTLEISVSRNNKIIECYSKLYKYNDEVIIGISLSELKSIETNPKVEFTFKKNESGSSRGLMCALEIYNRITKFDLTKGDIISGTGSIDDNGVVGSIDGVKYKLTGAVKKKADVFIVPTKNYAEAIKIKNDNNYDIEIIEADNLHNVIEKLKNR